MMVTLRSARMHQRGSLIRPRSLSPMWNQPLLLRVLVLEGLWLLTSARWRSLKAV